MKIGIVTINDNNNYGNRLQNYALQEFCKKINPDIEIITIRNSDELNRKESIIKYILKYVMFLSRRIKRNILKNERAKNFKKFNQYINYNKNYLNLYVNAKKVNSNIDYFLVGSDQVWNPYGRMTDVDLLTFATPSKRVSFSASLGISEFPQEYKKTPIVKNELKKFKEISVREDKGKEIVEELTGRKDVEVLIDPTMLLTVEEWDKVAKKPKMLNTDKYILKYFLGNLSEERKKEIDRVAKENNCEVINILDKNSPFYECGPSELLYLEKNAFLICTDSFHSSVFSILYNKPFIVFDREGKTKNMNSRIETLLTKFKLKDRKFIDNIKEENLICDYTEAYNILEKEREKAKAFLKKALNL